VVSIDLAAGILLGPMQSVKSRCSRFRIVL